MPKCEAIRGYSLLELLLTLAIVAAVLTVGVPSFSGILANARLRTETDSLFHAIHLARKESIVQRRVVTLCPTRDELTCSGESDWSGAWMMFVNEDRDWPAVRDPDEPVLRVHVVDPAVRITANRRSFSLRTANLRATNGTLVFCDRSKRAKSRALVVSYTGRPRVAYADRRGRSYACAD